MNPELNIIAGTCVLSCQARQISTSHPNPIIPLPTDDALEDSKFFRPVDQLMAGDFLIGMDNHIYQVEDCSICTYEGPIITITTSLSGTVDHIHPNSLILVKRRVQSLSEFGGWSSIPSGHFQRARELRTQMTPPEWKLWGALSNEGLGIKFRAQHPIGPYIVDFYARKAGLVVEVDGEIAHGTPEQKANDQTRDAWLRSTGLTVLRYSASEVFSNIEGVIADINYYLQQYVLEEIPQAQWLYSKNITSNDAVYLTKEFLINHLEQVGITHFQSNWYKVILNTIGNIITQTLIFKTISWND